MKYTYKTQGTCSKYVTFRLEDGIVFDVKFDGGCNGNLKAIGRLVEGKPANEIENLLIGNTCGYKATSCADQLARALRSAENGTLPPI